MSHKDKRLYNYVINTLGISKTLVMECVDKRLEELVNKHLASKLESNYVERLILDRITEIVTTGVTSSSWWNKSSFESYVKKCLKQVIEEKVNKEFNLEVKIVPNDSSVVRRG